ncbi:MAG: EAL domain-containing response regulator [Steroidobacteraceae bacterium]|nr:EAL domain-containing response regulator [Steroidobacteraceae bacterium]
MTDNINRLLVVDDQEDILDFAAQVAESMDYAVALAASADEFYARLGEFGPTLIVLDLQMPGTDGIELLRYLGRRGVRVPLLISSGMDSRVLTSAERFGRSVGLDISGVLQKPLMLAEFEAVLARHRRVERVLEPLEFARAVDRGQLVLHYQPKLGRTRAGWQTCGVEALLRWDHPDLGMIYPDRFIPLAESSGLIAAATDWVLQEGVRQVGAWCAQGIDLGLAINMSPKLVTDLDFPDRLSDLLAAHGVRNSSLTLEITESAALEDPTRTMDILTRLRVKDFGLSLDDFGTGYSSLTQLYRMPFNELKIDKSLGMDLGKSREAETMVRSLVGLAHGLGLKVCAEGVETPTALDFLAEAGCDFAQGYHVGRPMPASAIADHFASVPKRLASGG